MKELWIVGVIILLLIILLFIGLYFVYRMTFFNELKGIDQTYNVLKGIGYDEHYDVMYKLIDDASKIKYERVSIKSFDGLTLSGKYYHVSDNANTCIEFHGYKGDSIRDMSGGLQFALRLGLNVLLIDERGHGLSEGRTISFGVLEKEDVLPWINYINEFKNPLKKDIMLMGISMGASTLALASKFDFPHNVKGIILDCPYSDQKEEILLTVDKLHLNRKLIWPFIVLAGKIYGHFDIDSIKPIEAIKDSKLPILIIHGEKDYLVPVNMSYDMYNQNKDNIKLLVIDGAVHGVSYIYDKDLYEQTSYEFMKEVGIL